MQTYKGFSYPTVREFFADEEKYTNPDNENQWLYYMGGINIVIDKDKGNKEVDEIFKHFIDVVYEDAKKVNGAVADAVKTAKYKARESLDQIVQEKTIERAKELEIDIDKLKSAASNENTLSEEELQKIADKFNGVVEESEELKKVAELPSSNGKIERDPSEVTETGEMKMMTVGVNPNTGEHSVLGDASDLLVDNESFEDMIARINSDEIDFGNDDPVSEEEISKVLSDKNSGLLSELIDKDYPLSSEATKKMMSIVDRRMKKEDFHVYKEMPEEVQKLIDKYAEEVTGVKIPMNSIEVRTMKNRCAEALLDELISTISMDRIQSDFGKEVQDIFSKGASEVSETIVGYSSNKIESYRKSLENVEDPEKKAKLQNILDKIDDAYNLGSLKDYAAHCKIKKFELQKPDKIFNRFTNKYKNSKYDIFGINMMIPILSRHLGDKYEDITMNDIIAFLIAFCKQTTNYNPTDIPNHSYMYFVTYNVALMDVNVSDNTKEVTETFTNNVYEVIKNLRSCNGGILDAESK